MKDQNENAHEYLLYQVMAQATVVDVLYDLLVRHRIDLAKEALEDLQETAKRSKPPMNELLGRSAQGWQSMLEDQQRLLQAELRSAERP